MDGIDFVTDRSGKKTAVVIDLEQWGELWEDFYDILVARTRQDESEISWEDLQAEVNSQDRENG